MVSNIAIIFAGLADEKLHIVTTCVLKKSFVGLFLNIFA